MGARYCTDLADVLRAAGLTVIEVGHMAGGKIVEGDAWKRRGRSSGGFDGDRPWAICWHHTASAPLASAEANVGYATFNSSVAPICQLYLHRDGVWYVCAAGGTNTEGKGGPWNTSRGVIPVDQGNVHFLSIEAGNTGVGEPWPREMIDSYFAGTIAMQRAYGMQPDDVATHARWTPQRKIDPATAPAVLGEWQPQPTNTSGTWSLEDIRAEIAARSATPEPPPEPEPEPEPGPAPEPGDELMWTIVNIIEAHAVFMGMASKAPNGALWIPQMEWVNGDDQLILDRYKAYQAGGAPETSMSFVDLKGVCLLGSIPGRDDKFAAAGHAWSRDKFGKVVGTDQ